MCAAAEQGCCAATKIDPKRAKIILVRLALGHNRRQRRKYGIEDVLVVCHGCSVSCGGDASAKFRIAGNGIRNTIIIGIDGRNNIQRFNAYSLGDFDGGVLTGALLDLLDCFRCGCLRRCRSPVRGDACCKVGAFQVHAAKRIAGGDGAQGSAACIGAGTDKNNLAATLIVNNPGNLGASDAEAGRRKPYLHRLGARLGKFAGNEPKRPLGDLCCHRTGLGCRVIDEFVHRQSGAASQCKHRFIKKHDLHSAAWTDLDLIAKENAGTGRNRAYVTATILCRHPDDIASERCGHANEIGGDGTFRYRQDQ